MTNPASPPTLLKLASEAIVPLINGCAKSVGPRERLRFQRAIDYFGPAIAASWREWARGQRPEEIHAGLVRLGELSAEEARREATAAVTRFATASPQDQETAIDYLAAIPAGVTRYVPRHPDPLAPPSPVGGVLPWPLEREQAFLGFLPIHVPPFSVGSSLANTSYRLTQFLGGSELGCVYRIANTSDARQQRVVKFCLDNAQVGALAHEREHLNRLLTLGLARWSAGLARLYSYNLDTPIPYLVYEFCPGNDLTAEVRHFRQETGTGFPADKALELVMQIAGALAFVHGRGMIYSDLKPANVLLVSGGVVSGQVGESGMQVPTSHSLLTPHQVKLTDFGTSAVTAGQAAQTCPVSSREGSPLVSAAAHVRLLHGSNSSMYMSSEQRRGDRPEPHHDIYTLGVLWYQILVGDVTREMHPGWAEELTEECQTPKKHVEVMQRCVGYYKRRPANAAELLTLLQTLTLPEAPTTERYGLVSLVSERLRKLDERVARTRGARQGSESMAPAVDPASSTTEVLPKNAETIDPETLWG